MSTKSTIAHGPNFHLYHEAFDEDNVYLSNSKEQSLRRATIESWCRFRFTFGR